MMIKRHDDLYRQVHYSAQKTTDGQTYVEVRL